MGTTVSKPYPEYFKKEAVKEAQTIGNISETARKHGIHVNTLSRWIKEVGTDHLTTSQNEENDQAIVGETTSERNDQTGTLLRSQIEELNDEIEYFKKDNANLQKEIEQLQESLKQLNKDLLNHQQHIGRMYMENERLKEKISIPAEYPHNC